MSEELKVCPFCGHEADTSDDYVCCSNCECIAAAVVSYPHVWNRRTPDRAALVEVARRAIDANRSGMSKSAAVEHAITEYLKELTTSQEEHHDHE